MAKIVINTELDTKSFDKQIAKLESDIKRYTDTLKSDAQIPVNLRMSQQEKQELEALIERLRNQLVDLKDKAKDVGDVGEEAGEKSGKGFEKGLKALKRFTLGLLGIRGAFSMIRRATNSYLEQHQDTANKLNAIWVALGNALAPIIEIIADAVLHLIGYLNVFLQALGFDVDLTKNMNKSSKAIKGTTKAMKELNNEVYSFDEMNKQSKDTSVGGGGGTSGDGTNGFKMPELDEGIVKKLQDIAKWLKENWELIGMIALAIGGLKVAKWLGTLGSIIGGGFGAGATGLLGLTNILKGLLAMELIAIVISLVYYGMQLNELKELNTEIEKTYEKNTKEAKKVNKENLNTAKTYEKGSKAINDYVNEMKEQIEQSKVQIEAKKRENSEMSALDKVWDTLGGTASKNNKIIKENTQRLIDNATNLQELAKEGKLTDEQMQVYNETMGYLNDTYQAIDEQMQISKNNMGMLGYTVDETTQDIYNQIKGLQEDNKQIKTTFESGKKEVGEFKTQFGFLNNLVAKPKIKFEANIDELKATLSKLSTVTGLNIGGTVSGILQKIRGMGLAKGGIVNNPGRGVPIGNVITGEATNGAEGVIPMNNNEMMDILGQSIARHVTINLTNNTMLDSRVIARETTKINNDMNFITNGRGV